MILNVNSVVSGNTNYHWRPLVLTEIGLRIPKGDVAFPAHRRRHVGNYAAELLAPKITILEGKD